MQKIVPLIHGCVALVALCGVVFGVSHAVRAQSVLDEWATVKAPPPPALKAVTLDPKKTVYMVLDFRMEACTPANRPRCAAALPHVEKLLTEARAKGVMIVHTTTTRSTAADIPPQLKPLADERVITAAVDKLSGSDLPDVLKAKGIDTVLISGTSANGAVLNTAAGALVRSLKPIIPVDTMPADGAYQEQFVAWQIGNGPTFREEATLTRSDMVTFK